MSTNKSSGAGYGFIALVLLSICVFALLSAVKHLAALIP